MTLCASGGWLEQLGCLALQPQTAVDIALVALAAGVAVLILRRQLRNDRQAMAAQAAHALKLSVSAAQRPYIVQLGTALLDLGVQTEMPEERDHWALGAAVYAQPNSEAAEEFEQIWNRLRSHIRMNDWILMWELSTDHAERWKACHTAARRVAPGLKVDRMKVDDPTIQAIGKAASSILFLVQLRAGRVGAALLAWDGISELDLRSEIFGWTRPLLDAKEFDDRRYRTEYKFQQLMLADSSKDVPAKVRRKLVKVVGPKSELNIVVDLDRTGPIVDA